jgi:hypothetical protein
MNPQQHNSGSQLPQQSNVHNSAAANIVGGAAFNLPRPANQNAAGNYAPTMPEIAPVSLETGNFETEQSIGAATQQPAITMPTPTPTVQPATAQPAVITPTTTDDTTTPATAADVDLIEKEWVMKAKTVISQTKSDPAGQERMIAELMRDYVKKRYGKEVGKAPED